MKKKLLALVCALALPVSLVGCALSTPDTEGKIGDFEVTSGLYLLAQYDAYQQAAQLADSEQDTSKVKSFLKATITTDADTGEPAVVKDYVAQKTLETLQTLAAVDARFTELGGELTEEQKRRLMASVDELKEEHDNGGCPGSVTDPEKRYHLELAGNHRQASRELCALLTEMGFLPRMVIRGAATEI